LEEDLANQAEASGQLQQKLEQELAKHVADNARLTTLLDQSQAEVDELSQEFTRLAEFESIAADLEAQLLVAKQTEHQLRAELSAERGRVTRLEEQLSQAADGTQTARLKAENLQQELSARLGRL